MNEEVKCYLSHGMGVNSTALMLLLDDWNVKYESVFIDHGGEYPETYEYLDYLQDKGHEITVIEPEVKGCSTIEGYCLTYGIKPLRMMRWCTDRFKLRPLKEYVETPCTIFIGVDAGEIDRAYKKPLKKDIKNSYPLVEQSINRKGCKNLIRNHGYKIPYKSGCWFCPFQSKKEIQRLKYDYPELYQRRKEIINNADREDAKKKYHILPKFQE